MNSMKEDLYFKSITTDTFKFQCHRDISCFTKCCANLNLILTPYDILRLKNRLLISSGDFLERFAITKFEDHILFPMVYLKMKEDGDKKCPFVTHDGCSIYEDRPGACRIYPLGRAAMKVDSRKDAKEDFFIVDEAHCLGFMEDREWTVGAWMEHEGVGEYNAMNDLWLDIITSRRNLGPRENIPSKVQMFHMASYNLDKFREFIFKSKFLKLFEVEGGLKDALISDDVALMNFSFDWLRFSLFGEQPVQMRPRSFQDCKG